MSDAELPHDAELPEQPETDDEAAVEDGGLLIIPGGVDAEIPEADALDESAPEAEEADETAPDALADDEASATEQQPEEPDTQFTLDELVAEMAGVSAVGADSGADAEPVVAQRVDPLAAVMSEAFEEVPVENEMWTRLPFWILGAAWVSFAGVITYLLWSTAKAALTGTQLWGVLIFGGPALVAAGAVMGFVVWSRARVRCAMPDRGVVGRAILLRAVGWTATGVALWVVSMIVLSLHSLDVIP
jgi:hypothetical protein